VAAPGEPLPAGMCAQLREDEGLCEVPVVLAVDEQHLRAGPDVSLADELIVRPYTALELGARIQRAGAGQGGAGAAQAEEVIRVGTLVLNLATYQVAIGERPVDFTYMEHGLLKFLITHPRRVFSREALLSAVWGYDYYGGARTVDVHIRRLRAKLVRMSAQIAGTGARAGTATAPSQGTGVAGDETGASGGAASQARPRKATYPGFRATLKLVGTGSRGSRDLSFDEACDALGALLRAEATSAQAGAFLIATRIKGESPEELAGYAQALRDAAEPMSALTDRPLVACAGAYDGSLQAPHLSLAAAIVAGACGAGIVVHCGPRLGPKYGVSARDVLAALGAPRSPTRAQSEAMLARAGVTVVDTSRAVQGWNALTRLRNEVGLRGPVHSAEKLLDYFGARRFVVGYTHSAYAGRLLGALALLGAERALAVRGTEGSDVVRPGRPVAYEIASAAGGEIAAARLTEGILDGSHHGPERDAVVLSAALRLYAAGLVRDARDGLDPADGSIRDGAALATLQAVIGP